MVFGGLYNFWEMDLFLNEILLHGLRARSEPTGQGGGLSLCAWFSRDLLFIISCIFHFASAWVSSS
jgi:hypothetical protein